MDMEAIQDAYRKLGRYAMAFADGRPWDRIVCVFSVGGGMSTCDHRLEINGEAENKGGFASDPSAMWEGLDAAVFLGERMRDTSGQTVWGLTFTLYPDGKFNIEYDYERPDWYSEEDERADAERSTLDASAANTLGLRLNSLGAEIEIVDFKPDSPVSAMLSEALSWLRGQTERLGDGWGLGSETAWNLDMNEGTLRFSFADGREVTCPVQVIGTYDTTDASFLWGWDHPSVPEPLRRAARRLHESEMCRELEAFANRVTFCSEADAWAYTAAAAKLDEAIGAYRGRSGDTWVYMSIASPR